MICRRVNTDARARGEQAQHLELGRRQENPTARRPRPRRASGRSVTPPSSRTSSPAARSSSRRRSSARMRPSSSRGRERLRDVVVGADLEPLEQILLRVARRQHDDRHAAARADAPADLGPAEPGQHRVEEHEVDGLVECGVDGRRRRPARPRPRTARARARTRRRARATARRRRRGSVGSQRLRHPARGEHDPQGRSLAPPRDHLDRAAECLNCVAGDRQAEPEAALAGVARAVEAIEDPRPVGASESPCRRRSRRSPRRYRSPPRRARRLTGRPRAERRSRRGSKAPARAESLSAATLRPGGTVDHDVDSACGTARTTRSQQLGELDVASFGASTPGFGARENEQRVGEPRQARRLDLDHTQEIVTRPVDRPSRPSGASRSQ